MMRAISLRQPWATWVVQGKKTMEIRTWTVSYRGPMAIHASQTVNREVCRANGIDPDRLTLGGVVGLVDLVDVIELDASSFQANQSRHMAQGMFDAPRAGERLYGWVLQNAQELADPIPYHGRIGLFNLPDALLAPGEAARSRDGAAPETEPQPLLPAWDERAPFELRVLPESGRMARQASYRIALYQRAVEPPPHPPLTGEMRLVADLTGSLLKAVADQVLETLRQNGYKATDLSAARRDPFVLDEESGVRLGLLFMAVRHVSKMNRVEAMSQGIRAMTSEELYYWFSKCTSGSAERAQKALRILLADE